MGESRGDAGLARPEKTTGAWGYGEEKTRAEGNEERRGHEEVGLGKHKTHRLGDEAVHEEEHESVEEDGHLIGFAVHELDVATRGGHENTGAEREKKGGRDGNFLGSDIREHLIYAHIIFSVVNKVVKCSTPHHLFVESILVNNAPEISPNVCKSIFIPIGLLLVFPSNTFMIRVVLHVTKLNKITKLP
jgi:hypothetical protein